jgi:hypothetical protein
MRANSLALVGAAVLAATLGVAVPGSTQDEVNEIPSGFTYAPAAGPTGTEIQVSGSCPSGGPGTGVFIRLARRVDPGETPFDTSVAPVLNGDGSFAGILRVPDEAPPDRYSLRAECNEGDAVLTPPVERAFEVTGIGPPASVPTTVSPPTTLPTLPRTS